MCVVRTVSLSHYSLSLTPPPPLSLSFRSCCWRGHLKVIQTVTVAPNGRPYYRKWNEARLREAWPSGGLGRAKRGMQPSARLISPQRGGDRRIFTLRATAHKWGIGCLAHLYIYIGQYRLTWRQNYHGQHQHTQKKKKKSGGS